MFNTLIVQPIFNLLVFIYGVLPGHDFGVAIIIFTIIVRFALWPMARKQLHNTRALREIQPDIKKIRENNKGDKQKEAALMMELYKEKGVSPFSTIGGLFIQLPVLIGLFQAIRKLVNNTGEIADFSYDFVADLPFIQTIIADNSLFDKTMFGVIDLGRQAYQDGTFYAPLVVLALAAALMQFYQARQLSPDSGEKKKLRDILKGAAGGDEAEQSDINAAMANNMRIFFPIMTGFFAATFPGSLALYWTAGSAIALIQNKIVLGGDVKEMQKVADVIEGEVVEKPKEAKAKKKPAVAKGKKKQSRKARKK